MMKSSNLRLVQKGKQTDRLRSLRSSYFQSDRGSRREGNVPSQRRATKLERSGCMMQGVAVDENHCCE